MQEIEGLRYTLGGLVFLCLLSLLIFLIAKPTSIKNQKFRKISIVTCTFSLLTQLMNFLQWYKERQIIWNLSLLFFYLTMLFLLVCDLEFLKALEALTHIQQKSVHRALYGMFMLFIVYLAPFFASIFTGQRDDWPDGAELYFKIGQAAWVATMAMYQNIQAVYFIFILKRYIQSKYSVKNADANSKKAMLANVSRRNLLKLMIADACLLFLQLVCAYIYVHGLIFDDEYVFDLKIIGKVLIHLEIVITVYILRLLPNIAFPRLELIVPPIIGEDIQPLSASAIDATQILDQTKVLN